MPNNDILSTTMTTDQNKILAFVVFELRALLSNHLGDFSEGNLSDSIAAHLAYALHNQALSVLEGRSFDTDEAIDAIAKVDEMFGEHFVKQLTDVMSRESQ
jgi:hypothetical protein